METPASLDVVEDAGTRAVDAQERRADAADTRAGLVLGFSGLVVSFGGAGSTPGALTARLLATLAAVAALSAANTVMRHRTHVDVLRQRYLADDPVRTRLALLEVEARLFELGRTRLARKVARLRLASALLTAAVAFALAGATVELIA